MRVASSAAHFSARFFALLLAGLATVCMAATSSEKPHLLQRPALSQTQIVFNYAGDLWSVDRKGGHAVRLTVGVGVETSPVFSPNGQEILFVRVPIGQPGGSAGIWVVGADGRELRQLTRDGAEPRWLP